MNRQAKRWLDDDWIDFGNVTLEAAAMELVRYLRVNPLDGITRVMVRDEGSPDAVFFVDVRVEVVYSATCLRGDDANLKKENTL